MSVASVFRLLAWVLLLGLPGPLAAQQGIAPEQVAKAADPAVGRVIARLPDGVSTGSGFVLASAPQADAPEGALLFLTNLHVVAGAAQMIVGFQEAGTVFAYDAETIATTERLDLAVLLLTPTDDVSRHEIRPLRIRTLLARKGESVVALGFPGSADSLGITLRDPEFFSSTLTNGTVSKTMRASWHDATPEALRFDIVQHTASINPGNSGGPLLDACAAMVGLNTATAAVREDGFQPNDTYWATASPVVAEFLREEGLPFSEAAECTAGPAAADPIERPAPSLPERAFRLPTWAVALISLGLAGAVIGSIVALMQSRAKAGGSAGRKGAAVLPAGGAVLTLLLPGGARQELGRSALERGVRIGRAPEAEVRIDAAGVSRLHALLRLEGRRLLLTDLGSTNQTTVDGVALPPNRPVPVTSASRIALGGQALALRQGPAGPGAR